MSQSANVKSVDAIKRFHAAVLMFQEEARLCVSSLELQLLKVIEWLERDRPGFWKREIEVCYREQSEARVRLHQCRMRRTGDFRPSCHEEKKDLEKAKKDLHFAQKQIPVVKYWTVNARHEANEYHGRSSQLTQMLERDIPRLLNLLREAVERLEAYESIQVPGATSRQIQFQRADFEATDPDTDTDEANAENEEVKSDDDAKPDDGANDTDESPEASV